MKCRTVWNERDEEFTLTEDEEKFVRALERMSKMNRGRIKLFGNGLLSIRINDYWNDDNIDSFCKVYLHCEGGDGGDNNPDL